MGLLFPFNGVCEGQIQLNSLHIADCRGCCLAMGGICSYDLAFLFPSGWWSTVNINVYFTMWSYKVLPALAGE